MTDSTPRRRRLLPWLVGAALLLALIATTAVWWVGHQATISVSAATAQPRCEGTELTTEEDFDEDFEHIAIPMRRGFTCTVAIEVVNRGDRGASIGRVSVPVSGPGGGAGFEITHVGGAPVPDDDQVEATAVLDRPLGPGDSQWIELHVVFRDGGCSSEGGSLQTYPTIEVESLLASHDLLVSDLPLFLGTADSSCDT